MGIEWGNEELKKPYDQRHPLLKMYDALCRHQKETIKVPGEIHSAQSTGAISAYMWLSYSLYLIAHNIELQTRLIARLQHIDQFAGANYETYIAAIFIRAGFLLEFENESDRTTSHCEFTATHIETGKKYSVECKFRHRKNLISSDGSTNFKLGIRQPLHKALKKKAVYQRIIFIDLNLPASEVKKYQQNDFIRELKKCENDLIGEKPAPSAYVFLTNYSYHYDLKTSDYSPMYFLEGYKIPNFGNKEVKLHEAIQARKEHLLIVGLWDSIKKYNNVPSTFDGSIPEFCGERLSIGKKYIVNDQHGKEQIIELQQAVVNEADKKIITFFKAVNEQIHIIELPMSESQIDAYRQNKDTFFGVYKEQPTGIENPLDMFDFFMKGFKNLSKNELLNCLKTHPGYETFFEKEHAELLESYCEALTAGIYNNAETKK